MINRLCRALGDLTARDWALLGVILFTVCWIAFGALSRTDPYPFQFLGVICNVAQLWMIFVLANSARGSHDHHKAQHGVTREYLKHTTEAIVTEIRHGRPQLEPANAAALDAIYRDLRQTIYEVHGLLVKELQTRTAPLFDLVQPAAPVRPRRALAKAKPRRRAKSKA